MKTKPRNKGTLKRSSYSRRRIRRRRTGAAVAILVLLGAGVMAVWGTTSLLEDSPPGSALSANDEVASEANARVDERANDEAKGEAQDAPEQVSEGGVDSAENEVEAPAQTPAAAAYASLAGGVPGVSVDDLLFVQQSVVEPSKAAVWFEAPDREDRQRYYIFFTEKASEGGDEWRVFRSVVGGDHEFPRDLETMIPAVPNDLKTPVLRTAQSSSGPPPTSLGAAANDPRAAATQAISSATGDRDGWSVGEVEESDGFYRVRVERDVSGAAPQRTVLYLRQTDGTLETAGIGEDLTGAELPRLPENLAPAGELAASGAVSIAPATPVYEGGAKGEVTERGIEEAVATVEGYPGVAGFYVIDPRDGSGYGIRPDEEFFSASTIKVAVMAAVYRKMDSGDLEYSDQLTTNEEDWAAGAGWLRWNTPGANTTVEDALWLMMTESDNVATNVLMRAVGGPDYVNSVARDLGAQDTDLFWKLSSERAAVPALDNHTTPRDMATMLAGIYEGKGFEDFSRDEMLDLMSQNNLEYWLEGGVPNGIVTANKGGWLDGIYNDVGIVEYEEKPYVVAIYTMNGPELEEGSPILAEISGAVWLTESGKSKEEFGEDRAEQPTEAHPDSDPSPDEDRSSREDKPRRD